MGQELSQPLSPHAPELSPFSSQPLHPSSLIYDKTTKDMDDANMSDIDMAEDPYGSTASPNERSSTSDLPTETVDTTDHSTVDNATEQNTSDDTSPPFDTTDHSTIDNATEPNTSDDTNLPSDTLEPQWSYKRELRPMREPKRSLPNTWVDADTTGDFDPHEEARQARERRKRAKLTQRKKFDWNAGEHTKESDANRRQAAKTRPIFCIRFKTCSGKTAFAELCAKSEKKAELYEFSSTGYHLRKRGGVDDERDIDGVNATGVRVIGSEAPLDLRNQPAGRGCLTCLAGAQRCSLLDNEHSWPCDDCNDSGDDCQLIQVGNLSFQSEICELTISSGTGAQTGVHALPIF